jgi:hypothetical protein
MSDLSSSVNAEILITKAFELHDWITHRLDGLDIPREQRVILAVSCYDVVIEHHVGIATLLRSRINGSAFALVRPVFETFVRGVWLRRCATEDQISQFIKDKLDLCFYQLLESIEKLDAFQDGTLSSLKKNAMYAMHSYTHGGMQQAGRRTKGSYIEPNFSSEEIAEVIKLSGTFALLAFQQFAFEANRMDLAMEALQKLKGIGRIE